MNETPEIAIVIPVFNEEENVLPLTDELVAVMGKVGPSYEIMFVDDTSTDSTWEKIREARQRHGVVSGLRH
jgi:glycosyltransferase involved in cell wall biosynthesis